MHPRGRPQMPRPAPGHSGQQYRVQPPRLAPPGPSGQAPWRHEPRLAGPGPSKQATLTKEQLDQIAFRFRGLDAMDFQFLNAFNVVGTLAGGSFGVVVAAETKTTGVGVAIKVLKIGAKSATDSSMYREETIIRLMIANPHRNVLHFYGVNTSSVGRKYITSELSPIGDLSRLMNQKHPNGTPIWPIANENLSKDIQGIAKGIQHLHGIGIAHGDIKPANVLLFPQPGQWQTTGIPQPGSHLPELCDFSNSEMRKITDPPGKIMHDVRRYSINFSAPESEIDAKVAVPYDMIIADVYSIGCNLLCLLMGTNPFVPQKDLTVRQTVCS